MNGRYKFNGELIRDWLAYEGRKQAYLAGKLCVSDSTIGRMLGGECPKWRTIEKLADLMGVAPDALLIPKDGKRAS